MADKTVFAQLLQLISRYEFNKCVDRYCGNLRICKFSCWDQYLAMAFVQLTGRDGLRDIGACLRSHRDKLYRMGFRGKISRSGVPITPHYESGYNYGTKTDSPRSMVSIIICEISGRMNQSGGDFFCLNMFFDWVPLICFSSSASVSVRSR